MNPYKMRAIVDHIRSRGRLPTDEFGNTLPTDDLVVWFGFNEVLSLDEQRVVKAELRMMAEAELLADRLKSWS